VSLLVVVADTDATADQNGFDVVFILSTDIELGTIYFDFNIADFDNKRLFFIFSNFKIAFPEVLLFFPGLRKPLGIGVLSLHSTILRSRLPV